MNETWNKFILANFIAVALGVVIGFLSHSFWIGFLFSIVAFGFLKDWAKKPPAKDKS